MQSTQKRLKTPLSPVAFVRLPFFIFPGLCHLMWCGCVGLTEAQIRKELTEEETVLLSNLMALHSTSMSSFMVLALDLEESQ